MFFIDTDIETIKQYDPIKFIPYLNNCYDLLQSFFVEKLKGLPFDGKYLVEGDHRDPALISSDIYKDTQYWWLLMLYNDIVTLRSMRPAYNIKNEGPDDWKTLIANDQFNDLLKKTIFQKRHILQQDI